MKKLIFVLSFLLTLSLTAEVSAGSGDPALEAQLQRLNRAVTRTREPVINSQTAPAALEFKSADGEEQPTGIAGALEQAEQQEAMRRMRALEAAREEANKPKQRKGFTLREEAFDEMTKVALPLTPDQVVNLKKLFSQVQKAASSHPGVPPKPTSTSLMVNLAPGATPPMIRLSAGFVTSLVFLDATGEPWPISVYDLGDPRSYNVQWDKKGNTLMVQAISEYKVGNLAVVLKDLTTPIMLTLIPGQKAVDYRVDLRLPLMGPNSHHTPSGLPGKSDPHLLSILNGVAPGRARKLDVDGGDADIWLYRGKFFVRTRSTILSPGWISTMSSADGTHAYQMNKASVLLVSTHGKMHKLTVKGL